MFEPFIYYFSCVMISLQLYSSYYSFLNVLKNLDIEDLCLVSEFCTFIDGCVHSKQNVTFSALWEFLSLPVSVDWSHLGTEHD